MTNSPGIIQKKKKNYTWPHHNPPNHHISINNALHLANHPTKHPRLALQYSANHQGIPHSLLLGSFCPLFEAGRGIIPKQAQAAQVSFCLVWILDVWHVRQNLTPNMSTSIQEPFRYCLETQPKHAPNTLFHPFQASSAGALASGRSCRTVRGYPSLYVMSCMHN